MSTADPTAAARVAEAPSPRPDSASDDDEDFEDDDFEAPPYGEIAAQGALDLQRKAIETAMRSVRTSNGVFKDPIAHDVVVQAFLSAFGTMAVAGACEMRQITRADGAPRRYKSRQNWTQRKKWMSHAWRLQTVMTTALAGYRGALALAQGELHELAPMHDLVNELALGLSELGDTLRDNTQAIRGTPSEITIDALVARSRSAPTPTGPSAEATRDPDPAAPASASAPRPGAQTRVAEDLLTPPAVPE